MTCIAICYKVTLEKCICVSRTIIVSTVQPSNISDFLFKHECLGEAIVVIDPLLQGCAGSDDCNASLLAFKLSTLYKL